MTNRMKRIAWYEIKDAEQVRMLPQGTVISFGNVSYSSTRNMMKPEIRDAIDARCPQGYDQVQMDGIHRWEAEIFDGTVEALRTKREAEYEAAQAGFSKANISKSSPHNLLFLPLRAR